tara:strand:- start:347 stop:511 length:165 start_codon:yes stop_codon:yes gene_type:complete
MNLTLLIFVVNVLKLLFTKNNAVKIENSSCSLNKVDSNNQGMKYKDILKSSIIK